MNRLRKAVLNKVHRKARIRSKVSGTSERPRLSVYISNTNVTAQIIDDTKHSTLVFITTAGNKAAKGTMTEKASWVGSEVGKKAKQAKIKKIAFDRNGKLYHGRVKALADAARAEGLEF